MLYQALYPTAQHAQAAETVVGFFSQLPEIEAVLLVGSCARGKASPGSCLDIAVLLRPENLSTERQHLERRWDDFYQTEAAFQALHQLGAFAEVHLDLVDGHFVPQPRNWTGGPDDFELEIGNTLVYSVPLWRDGDYLDQLKERWLPYYDEVLRQKRLKMVRRYCRNDLAHIPLFVDRGLYFQSFNRLYDAFREFLQTLFIARRTYPIAYDKWIREQVEEILGLPGLYRQLVGLLEIEGLESPELKGKAALLEQLLEDYTA